jgi:hypothetical protein
VLIDGKRAGRTPLTLPVTAGKHRIEVRRPGYAPASRVVRVVEGARKAVSFEMRRGD